MGRVKKASGVILWSTGSLQPHRGAVWSKQQSWCQTYISSSFQGLHSPFLLVCISFVFSKDTFLYILDLTPKIPAHWSLRHDYHEFKARLNYNMKLCLENKLEKEKEGKRTRKKERETQERNGGREKGGSRKTLPEVYCKKEPWQRNISSKCKNENIQRTREEGGSKEEGCVFYNRERTHGSVTSWSVSMLSILLAPLVLFQMHATTPHTVALWPHHDFS